MPRITSSAKLERDFQGHLIKRIKQELLPGSVVLKNDPGYLQGIPDLIVLYNNRWGMLEVKASIDSDEQPNQRYYVDLLDSMSFAAFISPENEEAVLHGLEQSLRDSRATRIPLRE